jgi:predicted metalloprotease with PDZ domain
MRALVAVAASIAIGGVACGGSIAAPRAARPPSPPPANGAIVAEYTVHFDAASGELSVEARTASAAGATFAVDRAAEPFVRAAEAAPARDGAAWSPVTRSPRRATAFVAAPCAEGPCRLRYRFALREAARRIDDLDVATDEGGAVEAPPSTWLLAPTSPPGDARVRFRVTCSEGTSFATGVFAAKDAPGAWDISLDDLWTSPYTVFGPLRTRTVEAQGASIAIAMTPGKLVLDDDAVAGWVADAAHAVTTYLGRFPMPSALVVLVPVSGRGVGGGRTLSGGGGTVLIRVGERAPASAYKEDWVIVHEMLHLVLPSLPREQSWAEEGLSTYVEPLARVRAGQLSPAEAWRGLVEGLPNGLPGPGDRGLDRTPTWGRVYWGGALFWLLADVEIRKRTHNAKGLEHALRGVLDAGMNNAQRRSLDDVIAAGDRATGTTALRDLHDAMGTSPHPVDLAALGESLGVEVEGGRVRFHDGAELAPVRRAITSGKPP